MLIPSMILPLSLLIFNINKSFSQIWYDYNGNQEYHDRDDDYEHQDYHNKNVLKNIEDEDDMSNDSSNYYSNEYSNDISNEDDEMDNDYSSDYSNEKKKDTNMMKRRLIQSKISCNIKKRAKLPSLPRHLY